MGDPVFTPLADSNFKNTLEPTVASVATVATVATAVQESSKLWDQLNAIAVQGLITIILVVVWSISSTQSNFDDIRENWDKYKCNPLMMPFAGFYGHNTADNFNGCMKDIFGGFTGEVTAPFTSILTVFTEVLGSLMTAVNSIRTSFSTLGGGINVIFQEFTDRIRNFYFQLRLSAIRIKTLIGRMYATMFSVLYMGLSGITAAQSFGDTSLFSFLDTFCFPPETRIHVKSKGLIQLQDVQVGDVLLPTQSIVTTKFHFSAKGQPMVELPSLNGTDPIQVSTNHYIWHDNKWIVAKDHPNAVAIGPYNRHSLICLNTTDHCIPIGGHLFCDYDETSSADSATMTMIEERVNGQASANVNRPRENSPSFHPLTPIRLANGSYSQAHTLTTNTLLSTGARITGILHKQITEYCYISPTVIVGSATLLWNAETHVWQRAHTLYPVQTFKQPYTFIGLIVTPNSQIEVQGALFTRDYMELCSPDAETFYAEQLNHH
jgi:hypothetical protein